MDFNLIVPGVIFLVLGYLIGVKKMTWLLSGFNEKRVRDKVKLAYLAGGTNVFVGGVLILGGIAGVKPAEYLIMFSVLLLLGLLIYVNLKMVE